MANGARAFIISIQDDQSPSLYNPMASLIDCQLTIGDSPDDVTTKGGDGARELFTAGAIKTHDFSGNVVVGNETAWADFRAAKESSDPRVNARVTDGVKTYTGAWSIETLTLSGGTSGAVRAAVDLKSAGPITVGNV